MVKKFTANCSFNSGQHEVTFYIGEPSVDSHPLNFQSKWLADTKGGAVPANIMNSFSKLKAIAEKSRVSFEDLCAYVIEELKSSNSILDDAKQASTLSKKKNPK